MKTRILMALMSASLLAACTVGPNFKEPATPAPASYLSGKEAMPAGDQRAAMGKEIEGEWWSLFHSEDLDGVIAEGMRNNYNVAAAKAHVAEAQDEVAAAEGGFWPQLGLDATAGRQKYGKSLFGPSNFTIPPFTYYTVGPAVSFPLDLFGGTRRTVEEKKALAEYQGYELDAAYLTLSGNIAAQAFTLAAMQAQLQTIRNIVADDRRNGNLVDTSFKAGAATQADVLSAQSQLAADQTLLPPLEQQESVARHALAILAGHTPADWNPPAFALGKFTLPHDLPLSLPSELAHRRPDILAAEAQLHAASAAIGVATANMYPNITLTGTLTQQALTPGGLFMAAANAWSFAGNLTQPIFEGGTLKAKKKEAVDHYQAALATYQQTVITAFGQVADSLQALTHDAEMLNAQRRALKAAESSLTLARKSYQAGNSGILQVLDAERSDARAQLGVSKATAQRYLDTAQLFLSLGAAPKAEKAKK